MASARSARPRPPPRRRTRPSEQAARGLAAARAGWLGLGRLGSPGQSACVSDSIWWRRGACACVALHLLHNACLLLPGRSCHGSEEALMPGTLAVLAACWTAVTGIALWIKWARLRGPARARRAAASSQQPRKAGPKPPRTAASQAAASASHAAVTAKAPAGVSLKALQKAQQKGRGSRAAVEEPGVDHALLLNTLKVTQWCTAPLSSPTAPRCCPTRQPPVQGHTEAVTGLAFSPCGRHLGTVSSDKTVRTTDLAGLSGKLVSTHRQLREDPIDIAYGPDSDSLVILSTGERWAAQRRESVESPCGCSDRLPAHRHRRAAPPAHVPHLGPGQEGVG